MKKILFVVAAALMAGSVLVIACKKKESESDKGKTDAQARCECLKANAGNSSAQHACPDTQSQNAEYLMAFMQEMTSCSGY
jgi:hypothetical protein